jgi:hypothetical protein
MWEWVGKGIKTLLENRSGALVNFAHRDKKNEH